MELSIDLSTTPVKLFGNTTPPPMRRLYCYVEPEMYEEVLGIAHYEGIEISATVRNLLSFALAYYQQTKEIAQSEGITLQETMTDLVSHAYRYYKFRQGTLNPALPTNTKTFHCQICRNETSVRRKHRVALLNEEFSCCENCFFADRHIDLSITFLKNRR